MERPGKTNVLCACFCRVVNVETGNKWPKCTHALYTLSLSITVNLAAVQLPRCFYSVPETRGQQSAQDLGEHDLRTVKAVRIVLLIDDHIAPPLEKVRPKERHLARSALSAATLDVATKLLRSDTHLSRRLVRVCRRASRRRHVAERRKALVNLNQNFKLWHQVPADADQVVSTVVAGFTRRG